MKQFLKQNPIGLDAKIQNMQMRLSELESTWSIGGNPKTELYCYGRSYIIDDEGVNRVKYFEGRKKNNYEIISVAEGNKFFFTWLNKAVREKQSTWYEAELELYFILNLAEVKPTIEHIADFEVHNDVEEILNEFENVWIIGLETGYKRVFGITKYDQESDMNPYHVFKFTLGVKFEMSDTCCC